MRKRRRGGGDEAEVNMTPMLDIVFILLIFFIVTATFLDEDGIVLFSPPPPEDIPPPESSTQTILIQVNEQDQIFLNQRSIQPGGVTRAVSSQMAENGGLSAVAIEPHPDASHGIVTGVFDDALAANPAGVVLQKPEDRN